MWTESLSSLADVTYFGQIGDLFESSLKWTKRREQISSEMPFFPHSFLFLSPSHISDSRQLKLYLTWKAFGIDKTVMSEGNWFHGCTYSNCPGFVLSRTRVPSEDSEAAGEVEKRPCRRLKKILPVFALKALMYKNPCLFLQEVSGGKQLWARTCKM